MQAPAWAWKNRGQPRLARISAVALALLVGQVLYCGCGGRGQQPTVVVYTTHDQIYSEPVFRRFEEKTGVRVKVVYDTEATKTVGLANRLAAEARNPQCDVFWNNEVTRTVIVTNVFGVVLLAGVPSQVFRSVARSGVVKRDRITALASYGCDGAGRLQVRRGVFCRFTTLAW